MRNTRRRLNSVNRLFSVFKATYFAGIANLIIGSGSIMKTVPKGADRVNSGMYLADFRFCSSNVEGNGSFGSRLRSVDATSPIRYSKTALLHHAFTGLRHGLPVLRHRIIEADQLQDFVVLLGDY